MEMLEIAYEQRVQKSSKKLRRDGIVPGVVYSSDNKNSEMIQFDASKFAKLLKKMHGEVSAISLVDSKGGKKTVIIKDIQRDSLGDNFLHVDFVPVVKGKALHLRLPIELKGKAVGEKDGGIVELIMHELDIEVYDAENMPHKIEIDVTNLRVGDKVHVSDLKYDYIKIMDSAEEVVVTVVGHKESDDVSLLEQAAAIEAAAKLEVAAEKVDKAKEK